jgi:sugar phosphate isomerase/epimerase
MYTRRQFSRIALAGLALPLLAPGRSPGQSVAGVRLGVQTYSFRDLPRPLAADLSGPIVDAMTACGLTECELYSPHVEPASASGSRTTPEQRRQARDELRRWRENTPADHFAALRKKFAAAGIRVYAYNLSFSDSFTDAEIDRGFDHARALGAEIITASATLSVAKRVAPFAEKHKMPVAMHNHSNVKDPNEFATPASFEQAMAMSTYFMVNLDIGHFTAANFDALAFLKEHHRRITNLHIKDRKRDQGDYTPWGQGDAPIREVMQWLRDQQSPIRAYIEYEYKGAATPVDEVKACLTYVRQALGA